MWSSYFLEDLYVIRSALHGKLGLHDADLGVYDHRKLSDLLELVEFNQHFFLVFLQ